MLKQPHQKKSTKTVKNSVSLAPNPATVYLASLAPTGRRSMHCQLRAAIKILGGDAEVDDFAWQTLRYADIVSIRAQLLDLGRSINTVNLTLSAIRGVAQTAFHLGLLDAESLLHIKSVKRVPNRALPTGRSLSEKNLNRLLKTCQRDHSVRGIRDTALIALLATTGLRRAEVAALNLEQYDRVTGKLSVVQTKHNRDRVCPLPSPVKKIMRSWLIKRGDQPGALFCHVRKDQQIIIRTLSTQAIYEIVQCRAADAGLGALTPHDLRRTFVTRLLESNIDINEVRQLVGHSDIQTTSRYDHRIPNARQYVERVFSFK